jgi:hypothetical protein
MAEPQSSSATESRSTGFVAVDDGKGPPPELRAFGATYVVLWTLLLGVLFVIRRRQRALRARVERLEDSLDL